MWQLRCALALIFHETCWKLRMRLADRFLNVRKGRLHKIFQQLCSNGAAIIPNYYSEAEVVVIEQNCTEAFEKAKDQPTDETSIARKAGAIRIKQLEKKYPLLKRFSLDSYILFVNFMFKLRFAPPSLMYAMTDSEIYQSATEQEKKFNFGALYHFDTWFHQLKAIIPLDEVKLENGPTSYIPNSSGIHWRQFNYYLNKYKISKGDVTTLRALREKSGDLAYGDKEVLDSDYCEKIATKKGTHLLIANRGDLILFDTRNFHFATPPKSGYRRLLWMYF